MMNRYPCVRTYVGCTGKWNLPLTNDIRRIVVIYLPTGVSCKIYPRNQYQDLIRLELWGKVQV